jgi:predicted Fe-Mo cluster-binding NifX family protein
VRIAITAQENSPDGALDRRFGRAPFIFVGDSDSDMLQPHPNEAHLQPGGAGIAAAQWLVDQGVEVLVTGEVGPKAAQVLQAAGVRVHRATADTVADALAEFRRIHNTDSSAASPISISKAESPDPAASQEGPQSEVVLAVATDHSSVAPHFGRCEEYTIAVIKKGAVVSRRIVANPGHQPDFLPRFLAEQGVTAVIAGGMGPRAMDLFRSQGIEVIVGVTGPVSEAINAYRDGTLKAGDSTCTH